MGITAFRPTMHDLRIEITIDGGFAPVPGLAKPVVVEGGKLEGGLHAEALRLCRTAIEAAGDHTPPALSTAAPDARRYRLAIEIDGVRRELRAADPVADQALADLIDFAREHRTA